MAWAALNLYEFSDCKGLFPVTTKALIHNVKNPLGIWLLAMYFMINFTKGISSVF